MRKLFLLLFIFIFAAPFKMQAATIEDGALIRAADTLDVYIVKITSTQRFKRLILNPEIFNQYGHLKWENIQDVNQSILDQHATSDLVRAAGDEKVYKLYPNGDVGEKRWIKTANDFTGLGYNWNAIYTINNFERDSYSLGSDLEYVQAPETPQEPTTPTRNPMTINVPADYSTINVALNAAIDGDTISIKAGIYNENININKNLKLIGESVGSTIIDGQGSNNAIAITKGMNVLIQKLTIKSQNKYAIYCQSEDAVTATFKNNIIRDSGWGIGAEKNCQITVLNNLIYNNKNSAITDGAGILIKNNFSYGITSEIRNNTIDGNYHGIWSENANLKVINNVVSSNVGGKGAADSTGIYHSGTGASDNTYTDVWGNGLDYDGDATTGEGSINADPRFVNIVSRDYHLKTGTGDFSPCLDAGHPDMIYWDATYTSNTSHNDMGAYGGPDNISW